MNKNEKYFLNLLRYALKISHNFNIRLTFLNPDVSFD